MTEQTNQEVTNVKNIKCIFGLHNFKYDGWAHVQFREQFRKPDLSFPIFECERCGKDKIKSSN